MPSSSVFRKIEDSLEATLRAIRQEYDNPYPVLCEMDRKKFVEEEEDLRKRLEEMEGSASDGRQWRSLLGLPSPQARKCLQEAAELRKRLRDDINAKLRTRLAGMSSPSSSASLGRGSTPDLSGARTLETDAGHLPQDSGARPASTMTISPPSTSRSLAEASELIVYPVIRNEDNSEASSDRSQDSSSRPRRRAPPPPPLPRAVPQLGNSYLASEITSNSGAASVRRSQSARRPAPPPPSSTNRSRTPGSPIIGSFPSRGPSFPISVTMSSVSELTQQMDKLVSSIAHDPSSRQGRGRRTVSVKSNCTDIRNSNVEGLTENYGGSYNSGAVIHKTVLPRPVQQI